MKPQKIRLLILFDHSPYLFWQRLEDQLAEMIMCISCRHNFIPIPTACTSSLKAAVLSFLFARQSYSFLSFYNFLFLILS